MDMNRFLDKTEPLVLELGNLIDLLPDKGNTEETSQKLVLKNRLSAFLKALNGLEKEDFINETNNMSKTYVLRFDKFNESSTEDDEGNYFRGSYTISFEWKRVDGKDIDTEHYEDLEQIVLSKAAEDLGKSMGSGGMEHEIDGIEFTGSWKLNNE